MSLEDDEKKRWFFFLANTTSGSVIFSNCLKNIKINKDNDIHDDIFFKINIEQVI
jgi:hypothetical protein